MRWSQNTSWWSHGGFIHSFRCSLSVKHLWVMFMYCRWRQEVWACLCIDYRCRAQMFLCEPGEHRRWFTQTSVCNFRVRCAEYSRLAPAAAHLSETGWKDVLKKQACGLGMALCVDLWKMGMDDGCLSAPVMKAYVIKCNGWLLRTPHFSLVLVLCGLSGPGHRTS